MTSYVPPKKNAAAGWIGYFSLSPLTPTGHILSNPTLAAGDVTISLDGGAYANLGTLPAVTPAASGSVKVTLSQAETNADNIAIRFIDQTSPAEWCDLFINMRTAARGIDDLAFPATSGNSMIVDGSGNTKADALAINGSTGAAGNLAKTAAAIGRGTAGSSASTTSIPTSAFSPAGAVADQFKNLTVLFDADTATTALRGQAATITASTNAATPTLTVSALTTAPASGDTFSVI